MRSRSTNSRNAEQAALVQLSLFETVTQQRGNVKIHVNEASLLHSLPTAPPLAASTSVSVRERRRVRQAVSRMLTIDDMPAYPAEAIEAAKQALRQLPPSQLWFTYKDIQFYFRVSRATVARRLRDGLVPGVRMAGVSVVEDAPVRRFDRDQLQWVLLAVRYRQRNWHGECPQRSVRPGK
jgi:hypothetical protein